LVEPREFFCFQRDDWITKKIQENKLKFEWKYLENVWSSIMKIWGDLFHFSRQSKKKVKRWAFTSTLSYNHFLTYFNEFDREFGKIKNQWVLSISNLNNFFKPNLIRIFEKKSLIKTCLRKRIHKSPSFEEFRKNDKSCWNRD